ncbi:hypothetical protein Vretimale_14041, partial [Volvox reticuliferus]
MLAEDEFLSAHRNTHYASYHVWASRKEREKMQPAVYGTPGSFAGRRALQPPGGASSITFGGGGVEPSAGYRGGSVYSNQYSAQAGYGAYGGAAASDLSSQLNLPPINRRPPSGGRRAVSQPAALPSSYSSYGSAATPYSAAGGYGGGNAVATPGASSGYGVGGYGGGGGAYAVMPSNGYTSPYSAYGAGSSYGSTPAGAASSSYGISPSYAAPSPKGASAYGGSYGVGSGIGSAGAVYGNGSYGSSAYGNNAYGSNDYGAAASSYGAGGYGQA